MKCSENAEVHKCLDWPRKEGVTLASRRRITETYLETLAALILGGPPQND